MSIRFNKIRNVKNPSSAYEFAAATDFFCPEYDSTFYKDLVNKNPNRDYYDCSISPNCDSMSIVIAPNGRINIPSGIRVIIDDPNMCLLAVNKSGIAANKGLVLGACLVDADYRGEIGVIMINLSDEPFVINDGERIAQMVIARHEQPELVAVEVLDETERGEGGFGHTGRN